MRGFTAYLRRFTGFQREVKLLLLSTAIAYIVLGLSSVTQNLYLRSAGYPSATIGLLVGVSTIVSTVCLFPAGVLADRYGKVRLLAVSFVTFTLSFLVYTLFEELTMLTASSVLMGLSFATYSAPFTALLAEKTEPGRREYAFSLNTFLFSACNIVGNLLAGVTPIFATFVQSPSTAYRMTFAIATALAAVAFVPMLFVRRDTRPQSARIITIRSWPLVSRFILINALIGLGAGFFIPLLQVYLSAKFAATDDLIGLLYAVSNAIMSLGTLATPYLCERLGVVPTVTLTQGASVAPLLLMTTTSSFPFAAAYYAVRSTLMNMSTPVFTAFMMSSVGGDERASVSGLATTAWNGMNAASTVASGFLMDAALDLPVYLCGLSYTLSTVLFYLCFRAMMDRSERK